MLQDKEPENYDYLSLERQIHLETARRALEGLTKQETLQFAMQVLALYHRTVQTMGEVGPIPKLDV